MKGRHFARRCALFFLISLAVVLSVFWLMKVPRHYMTLQSDRVPANFWGVTFSIKYARELGIDWQKAFTATLDDLKIRHIRVPLYWDDFEQESGVYDFSDYDWILQEGEKRGVKFIIVVGRRVPRWPECHEPDFVKQLPEDEINQLHLQATEAAILHFLPYQSIEYWQIENEYFFRWFGKCPPANLDLIEQEIQFVRQHDSRPIIITDSGELHNWKQAAEYADVLGVTMYRTVWNKTFGYMRLLYPAWFYRWKAYYAGERNLAQDVMIAELQAEPWPSDFRSLPELTTEEWEESFTVEQLETNSELARRTGFMRAYFWGVEWWYFLRERGDDRMWNKAKEIIDT